VATDFPGSRRRYTYDEIAYRYQKPRELRRRALASLSGLGQICELDTEPPKHRNTESDT